MITRIGPYMTAEDYGSEHAIFDRHNQSLGSVSWYPRWRKHVFAPFERVVLSEDCLRALADWMRGLDAARSTKRSSSRGRPVFGNLMLRRRDGREYGSDPASPVLLDPATIEWLVAMVDGP